MSILPSGPPPDLARFEDSGPSSGDDEIARLVTDIKDYCITHGCLLKLVHFEEPTRVPAVGVNVSCRPTPFPRDLFSLATRLQPSINELYARAANDDTWLYEILRPQIEGEPDGLVASLWDVHVKVREAGAAQEVWCALLRADYMLHDDGDRRGEVGLKQVEVNTFSVAGGCHSDNVAGLHRWLLRRRIAEMDNDDPSTLRLGDLASNSNTASIVASLSAAHAVYQRQFMNSRSKCILTTVQPLNFNIADERPIEYGLFACYRCEWWEILSRTQLGPDRELLFTPVEGGKVFEVSVVYYRAGYDAAEYTPESNGRGIRLMLELSRAIKCPDVLMHISGFKSVQRALAEEGAVERLMGTHDHRSRRQMVEMRKTFMPMHVLDDSPEGLEARKLATDPAKGVDYVLKPNLEGGGNNVFRVDIPEFLRTIPEQEWHRYILMRLITPPEDSTGLLLTSEKLYDGPVVSELGVLGFAMWRRRQQGSEGGKEGGPEIIKNEAVGWTFKTKPRGVDEMSVVKGYGCFDCPMLV
ncbi:hypothetical protein LTR53_005091 [Teratosphaeriaceae sp. CCFEE 6253]|nr:hypothetical protein LTR53_005091 [Teratosphaeriaceae sp. CCFEE 6253]